MDNLILLEGKKQFIVDLVFTVLFTVINFYMCTVTKETFSKDKLQIILPACG